VLGLRNLDFPAGCAGIITMNKSLINRNLIRLILTAPPANALSGEPTEKFSLVTVPPA
jgi:hypothetical protein